MIHYHLKHEPNLNRYKTFRIPNYSVEDKPGYVYSLSQDDDNVIQLKKRLEEINKTDCVIVKAILHDNSFYSKKWNW